jgi:IS4 transposase
LRAHGTYDSLTFDLDALVIALIYRRRWGIELFFRWLKQHLRLRGFFSNSPNGANPSGRAHYEY